MASLARGLLLSLNKGIYNKAITELCSTEIANIEMLETSSGRNEAGDRAEGNLQRKNQNERGNPLF